MIYNQNWHIQLLKYFQNLKNQGKNLRIENPEEGFELSTYNIVIEYHFFWQNRYQVVLLMKDFLNKKIDGEELYNQVNKLNRKLINVYENFERSFEQFEGLATECDNVTIGISRKAIIILKGKIVAIT